MDEKELELYYTYISKSVKVKVAENLLKPEDLYKEARTYAIRNLITLDGQVFMTLDDEYYIPGGRRNE